MRMATVEPYAYAQCESRIRSECSGNTKESHVQGHNVDTCNVQGRMMRDVEAPVGIAELWARHAKIHQDAAEFLRGR